MSVKERKAINILIEKLTAHAECTDEDSFVWTEDNHIYYLKDDLLEAIERLEDLKKETVT